MQYLFLIYFTQFSPLPHNIHVYFITVLQRHGYGNTGLQSFNLSDNYDML